MSVSDMLGLAPFWLSGPTGPRVEPKVGICPEQGSVNAWLANPLLLVAIQSLQQPRAGLGSFEGMINID